MNKNLTACLVAVAVSLPHPAAAYNENVTHPVMAEAAVNKSALAQNPTLLQNLGLQPFATKQILGYQTLIGQFRAGAHDEDDGKRALNHFYDPYFNQPLTVALIRLGEKSPDWALEDLTTFPEQALSYTDARASMYQALTYNDPLSDAFFNDAARKRLWGFTFLRLGHVIHHVQDMAQPQHVRNDAHCDIGLFSCLGFYNPSRYERYTATEAATRVKRLAEGGPGGDAVYPGSGDYKTARDFWKNSAGSGIAEFTNRSFVSQGTNFSVGFFGNVAVSKYPLPRPGTPTDYSVDQLYASQQMTTPPGISALCSDVQINCTMTMYPTALSQMASTLSIFDQDMQAQGVSVTYNDGFPTQTYTVTRLFALNRFNFDDAHLTLIPKAVGYSAGLINYFFRGQIEITPPDEGVYGVVDHSKIHQTDPLGGYVGFDTIKLKLKNTTPGGEAMSGGSIVAVAKFHRNGCYKDDLTGEFLAATFPNPPCSNYRTNTEEIVLSSSVADAAGNPVTSVNLSTTAEQQYTFTFSQPIPINATDLFIQVVYKGPLGVENDAVVVATKDVFEPTYYAIFNSTDQIFYNGAFLPTNTSPPPAGLDANNDGVIDPIYDKTGLKVLFAFSDSPNDVFSGNKIANLPPGRFSRYAVLTGRSPYALQTLATNQGIVTPTNFVTTIFDPTPTAATNQLDSVSNTYRVTTYYPLRGVAGGNASLTYFRTVGANTNGDPKMLPVLVDKTPFPITCLRFNSPNPC